MATAISSGGQTQWKNSYASSAQLRLTLRVNGEEGGSILTPDGDVVQAGFDAPETAPTVTDIGAGNVPQGYYQYCYVYASSRYPFVQSDTAAGGEDWPRSAPSPATAVQAVGDSEITVECTTSARSDVDYILIYRTATQTTAALAAIEAAAGRFYYVGQVGNDTTLSTITFNDNNASNTGERLELDNFPCPTFRFTVFDGTYFWGWGNIPLVLAVTVDGTTVVTMNEDGEWFSGRDGQTATLSGITTGGYDGRGSFYFHRLDETTCELCTDPELTTAATIPFSGDTVITIRGPETTLFRSKAMNPFAWGRTTEILSADRTSTSYVSDLWAEQIGGGVGTAITLIPNENLLKLDTERPARSYAFDLGAADGDSFLLTKRTLDEAQSVSSHFSQFPMRLPNRQSVATGINAKALQILAADASSQTPIGDNVILTLRNLRNDDNAPDFFHGVFDYRRELNCWFVKSTDSRWLCDTLIYQHAPTGKWGLRYSPGISASCTLYDYETREYHTLVGDEYGRIGLAFADDQFIDWSDQPSVTETIGTFFTASQETGTLTITPVETLSSLEVVGGVATGAVITGAVAGEGYFLASPLVCQRIVYQSDLTFPVDLPDGTYSDTFAFLPDFTGTPVLGVANTEGGSLVAQTRYIIDYWNQCSFSEAGGGQVTLSVTGFDGNPAATGINVDSGEYEEAVGGFNLYIGATLCSAKRYFNAGTPQQEKRQSEAYATMLNTSTGVNPSNPTPYIRYFPNYGESPFSVENFSECSSGGSPRYKATSPMSGLYASFGIDIHEASYQAFQIADFTLKLNNA